MTVELTLERCFMIHVTAPKKTRFVHAESIVGNTPNALKTLTRSAFIQAVERSTATSIKPCFNWRNGAESTPTGADLGRRTQDGTLVHWREYAITRE